MKFKSFLVSAVFMAPMVAQAQTVVPPINPTGASLSPQVAVAQNAAAAAPQTVMRDPATPPPQIPLTYGVNPKLSGPEKHGVAIAKSYTASRLTPAAGGGGSVVFSFGAALPTIVCSTLKVCVLKLQEGETTNMAAAGDTGRWVITPAASGVGSARRELVLIKPIDIGLETNLVITTDRREYNIKLVSHASEWMPFVEFTYPDQMKADWEAFTQARRASELAESARVAAVRAATVLPTGESVTDLDFGFELSGDKPAWRPLRVYSDRSKTYIELPPETNKGEAPVLVGIADDDTMELINYRSVGNRLVVDQVIERAALLSGVGKRQVKVEISRSGGAE